MPRTTNAKNGTAAKQKATEEKPIAQKETHEAQERDNRRCSTPGREQESQTETPRRDQERRQGTERLWRPWARRK